MNEWGKIEVEKSLEVRFCLFVCFCFYLLLEVKIVVAVQSLKSCPSSLSPHGL